MLRPASILVLFAVFLGQTPSFGAPAPSRFAGTWVVEQVAPGGAQRRQGILTIRQNGNALSGVMRLNGSDFPLANVRESDGIISFSAGAPDDARVMLNYSGAVRGNELGVASQDLGSGSYTLTAQRADAPAPTQTAKAAPPPAAQPAAPSAPRGLTLPPPVARAPAAAPGEFATRLLGQGSPATGASPAATPPPAAESAPPPPAVVASASPPPAAPRPAPLPPSGPPLDGEWRAQQTSPNSPMPNAATLNFARDGDRLTGTLLTNGQEFPLFDVRQTGLVVSFSVVIPGTPYETINYSGTLENDRLAMQGVGESRRAYGLVATRQQQLSSVVAPPAPPAPAGAAPARAAPPASAAAAAVPTVLKGNWIAELTEAGSTSSVPVSLSFDADKASIRIGSDDLPLFDIIQSGQSISFTVIVPGTPYSSVRYSGVILDNRMLLNSTDQGGGVSTLSARRGDSSALPSAAASPLQASLAPPPPPMASRPAPSDEDAAPPQQAEDESPPQRAENESSAQREPTSQRAENAAPSPGRASLPALRDLPSNKLAATPPMGWASRQKLGSRMDETQVRDSVDALVETGLNRAGYVHVELGDGWQGSRDGKGVLYSNERFPDMKALGDYIHSKGLKFGLTTSAGPKSCNGFEGSYGYESSDAQTLAEWGVDYVVHEWCGADGIYVTDDEMRAAFQKMSEALRMTGRDIVYVISARGHRGAEQWAAKAGANVWRTGAEIEESWDSVALVGFTQDGKQSAPGAWNDPGLLQVGNTRMIEDDSRMQLNLWAILAAPLMLGNDPRSMTRDTVALLGNRELIAVSQDKLGRQGKRVTQFADTQVWSRPLADGSLAVAFFNTGPRVTSVEVTWEQLGIEGSRLVRDLWWHENLGIAVDNYVVVLAAGTSMLLTLSP
jgi:alpha-galactosidase